MSEGMLASPLPMLAPGSPWRRLDDVCLKITDGTHRSPANGPEGVPYITAKNIRRFALDLTELTYVSLEDHNEIFARCDPRPGDVLYIKDGATMGIAAVNTLDFEFSLLSSVALIRPNPECLRADYLAYWLNHPDTYRGVIDSKNGGAIQRMVLAQIRGMSIPVPSLVKQARIATYLSKSLELAGIARRSAIERLAATEALLGAYLREVFEGSGRSGWKRRRLGDLVTRHSEVIHPGDKREGVTVFVGLEHVEPNTGRRSGSGTVDLARMSGRKPTFRKGQIVYGYLRPYLNKVWVAEFDGCSSVDQFAFNAVDGVADTTFVAAFMRSPTFLERSRVVTTPGQLPRISIDEICSVRIDAPDVSEQRRIGIDLSRRQAEFEAVVHSCRQELAAIDAIPNALLRSTFNGIE